MSATYKYPENADVDPFTPELMKIWLDAFDELQRRRNGYIVWQAPAFAVFWILLLIISGPFILITGYFALVGFGIFGQAITPKFDYVVSKDRDSAKFVFSYHYKIGTVILDLIKSFHQKASQDMTGLLAAIFWLVTFPLWGSLAFVIRSVELFNELWWLKAFKTANERLQKGISGDDNRQHIRGTHILPSVQLSGACPPPIPVNPLEIADGIVTLLPDGGIVIQGGATFDQNSTFGNFSINGVTLTRESIELLKVSHKGSESSFKFDGNSWTET